MPQQYIDFAFVKQQASFEVVLSHYELKAEGAGTDRAVLCPFHTETQPSCKIELGRKIFQCFGCATKGNVLEFVALMEGNRADLQGAALKLAAICRIPLAAPRGRGPKAAQNTQEKQKRTPPNSTAEPEPTLSDPPAVSEEPINPPLPFALKLDSSHPYLAERGLTPELALLFGLGFCARGSMAGRICIPIHNEQGELVAYAGRWPGDEGIPEGQERYKLPARAVSDQVG